MKSLYFIPAILAVGLLVGCGGGTGEELVLDTATVTGRILDDQSRPVRDARVFTSQGVETRSSSSGAFELRNVRVGELLIRAEISNNGVNYRGQTYALTFDAEQRSNATIIVAPSGQLGRVSGEVRDRDGFLLENAPVFAYSGAGSSSRAFTNSFGEYEFQDLIGGTTYEVVSMARGYRSDGDTVTVQAGSTRNIDLTLGNPGPPGLTPPQDLFVVTWVSPQDATRSARNGDAYEAIKRMLSPDRAKAKIIRGNQPESRAITDYLVEAELSWDEQRFADHLGWGIYRANSANGTLNGLEFFSDPLSAYFFDQGLQVNRTYSYAVSTLSSLYPEFPNMTESDLSNVEVAETLNVLELGALSKGPLTFRWLTGSGADEFVVYVFDEFPGAEVESIWNNEASPVTGNSLVYNGPALAAGQTYYYVVLGLANDFSSRTISQIESFTP